MGLQHPDRYDVRKNCRSALQDNVWQIRVEAADALGNIEDRRAVSPLIKMLKDENKYVRKEAAEALGEINR